VAADDLGGVPQTIYDLIPLLKACNIWKSIGGLATNPPKCVIVPSERECSDNRVEIIRDWLQVHVHEWSTLVIRNCGTHLGFILGPGGGKLTCLQAERKWLVRATALASSQHAASLLISMCNSHVVTVLGYIAQLVCVPISIHKAENAILQRLYHLLQHSFRTNLFFHFRHVLKLPQPSSILAMSAGAGCRTAKHTVTAWRELRVLLDSVVEGSIPLVRILMGFTSYGGRSL
jgi:hypothetical protein